MTPYNNNNTLEALVQTHGSHCALEIVTMKLVEKTNATKLKIKPCV